MARRRTSSRTSKSSESQEKVEELETDQQNSEPIKTEKTKHLNKSEIDPEVAKLINEIYELHLKLFGEVLAAPSPADTPLREEYRMLYHAVHNVEKICVKAVEKIRKEKRYQKIRAGALSSMETVLQEAEGKIKDLQEATKRYKYDDPQQRSALSLMEIRFEELALDNCGFDDSDDENNVGGESSNTLDKYSECASESYLNELVLKETDELFRQKETHAKELEKIRNEERRVEKELAAIERQITKVRKVCKYGTIAEEVWMAKPNDIDDASQE
ncbi:unnamed protein product [Auanema sp. JU1783]|nr:unnamed protein product [Auanema sp. JU1783]